ncbi:secretion protein HlyD [Pirellula staleyi DSM 6068]|uniref:Secretion protein HlyD n=1 Tax=Pirellula staleyi (strain ATCC 27377 / DSM 6068 / ICPB 4128) TaxID=530564 RepID=D2R7J7_PIRSD|nr:HlyD family efflux transporter periplasmic adaptor subunit [Pirellula staleyi]ADB17423.1 secretion protein HlyD [Pirellula staleyi DSM 6068]
MSATTTMPTAVENVSERNATAKARTWQSQMLVRPSIGVRVLAFGLFLALFVMIVGMLYLPWQQTSRGAGRVVAYDPTERPQTIEAPIYGRVAKWGEGIYEGASVTKGQLILEIADNDPERALRLEQQVEATKQKLAFATDKVQSYFSQIEEYRASRTLIEESYAQLIAVAEQKIAASKSDLAAAKASEWQLEIDFQRQDTLAKEGIVGGIKGQEAKAKYEQAVAKRQASESYVEAAERERESKLAEGKAKVREAVTKVQEAQAKHQAAQGEEALARKELAEIQGKLAQFGQRTVVAPRDGILLRIYVADNTQMLKEGDPLFMIVPETTEQAVELWVNGNDIPLIELGREVRLQFEGWPAVQFAGWPSVAVGTFSGEVVAIDATDDGKGNFRVLVQPRPNQPWPSKQFLRQGARANGWVMLNEVRLGYEVWRQLNGFPPVIAMEEPKSDSKEKTKVKLPK